MTTTNTTTTSWCVLCYWFLSFCHVFCKLTSCYYHHHHQHQDCYYSPLTFLSTTSITSTYSILLLLLLPTTKKTLTACIKLLLPPYYLHTLPNPTNINRWYKTMYYVFFTFISVEVLMNASSTPPESVFILEFCKPLLKKS
jgi:hypothetical protein